jgi:CSLREA domain-containing protein
MTNTRTTTTNHYFRMLVMLATLVMLASVLLLSRAPQPVYAASTTFTVNSAQDDPDAALDGLCDVNPLSQGDQCTLRAAIQEANANNNPEGVDRIEFDIPGTGVHTILPNSQLPFISEPVNINGYSQPGSSVNTLARGTNAKLLIEIRGNNAGEGFFGALTVSASNSVIRGLVINHFTDMTGIEVSPEASGFTADARNVKIQGNFIGTDPSGVFARGNGSGVDFFGVSDSTVGGTSPASRNLISGNDLDGVFITVGGFPGPSAGSDDNQIRGNLIGTQRDGTQGLGNGLVGVEVAVPANEAGASGNRILSNSIFANGGLGINLGTSGPTPNDPGDLDIGSNNLQNKPSLGSARTVAGKTTIKGSLSSRSGATYTIQFFSNPSGTDEGRTFIGQKTGLAVDGSGKGTFTFSPPSKVAVGRSITATATNEFTGDTSEFSAPKGVVAG